MLIFAVSFYVELIRLFESFFEFRYRMSWADLFFLYLHFLKSKLFSPTSPPPFTFMRSQRPGENGIVYPLFIFKSSFASMHQIFLRPLYSILSTGHSALNLESFSSKTFLVRRFNVVKIRWWVGCGLMKEMGMILYGPRIEFIIFTCINTSTSLFQPIEENDYVILVGIAGKWKWGESRVKVLKGGIPRI